MQTIVYTQRVEIIEAYNERRDCADQRISEFIWSCGYLPIALPNNIEVVKKMMTQIQPKGIILVGGNSLVKYGGNAPERDEVDRLLIDYAVQRIIPLYGFCRGMQSILDYFGNSLVNISGHVAIRHEIKGNESSRWVNSYHNEACIELTNDKLMAVMKTSDGVIEKIQHRTLPIIGTMWHPEREEVFKIEDINMVKKIMEYK